MSVCTGNCNYYSLNNGSLSTNVTVQYKECLSGTTVLEEVVAGNIYFFCACDETLPTVIPSGVSGVTGPTYIEPCFPTTATPTPTMTPTNTITPTPTLTPTITNSLTPFLTPSQTKTPTPTKSITPTMTITPTNTITPTQSPIYCRVFNVRRDLDDLGCDFICNNVINTPIYATYSAFDGNLGSRYFSTYNDCINNVSSDWSFGAKFVKDNLCYGVDIDGYVTGSTTCTIIPPSPPPIVYSAQNECDVFTTFPLGVFCSTTNPTTSSSLDGSITLVVTGGTPPYNFFWGNGQRTNSIKNLAAGEYNVSVVDYYGDFTASTTCGLFAPTPTPTVTPTMTVTPTASSIISTLCLYVIGDSVLPIKRLFEFAGYINNKPRWFYDGGVNKIQWNLNTNRWEVSGLNVLGGILVSDTKSTIPDSGWYIAGGSGTANILVQQGICGNTPLGFNVQKTNTTCNEINNCNGVINIDVFGGSPPYAYSINNGTSYQQASFFTRLCRGSYVVSVIDSSGSTSNQITTLGYDNTGTTYTVSLKVLETKIYNAAVREVKWQLEVNPKLVVGSSVELNIVQNSIGKIFEPGVGTTNVTNIIYKNSTVLTPNNSTTRNTESIRPNCSPYKIYETAEAKSYPVTIGSSDIVSGTTISSLNIFENKTGENGCSTLITQDTFISVSSIKYSGCSCCNVIWDDNLVKIDKHELSNLNVNLPPVAIKYARIVRVGTTIEDALTSPRIGVYINTPFFTTNVVVYADTTTILTGYKYINYEGTIYNLNSSTGVVGEIVPS